MSPPQNANGFLLLESLFVLTLITMIVFIHLPLQQTLHQQQELERQRTSIYHQFYDYILTHENSDVVMIQSHAITIDRYLQDSYVKVTGTYKNRNNEEEVMTLYYVPKQPRLYHD
jgi:competence protein ComGC